MTSPLCSFATPNLPSRKLHFFIIILCFYLNCMHVNIMRVKKSFSFLINFYWQLNINGLPSEHCTERKKKGKKERFSPILVVYFSQNLGEARRKLLINFRCVFSAMFVICLDRFYLFERQIQPHSQHV